MDREDARRIAEAELARWNAALTPHRLADPGATTPDPDDEVVVTEVEEHARAWIVRYATRRWVRTRDVLDQLVGACPLVVDKTGGLHVYGSAPAEHDRFRVWLDEE